jgi:uncharacterized protein (TIGR02172 family)
LKYIKEKKLEDLREVSIEGCEQIGSGAHGTVYKLTPDMIVKVYRNGVSMDAVRKEQALARWAFVKDIPTAIPFDIVRVGSNIGTVFELLDAISASVYVRESREHLEHFIDHSVELMKQIHSIEAEGEELPDMKQQTLNWTDKIKNRFSSAHHERILKLVNRIPDRKTLLHADYHLKNIMISHDELMLIDMDTMCTGDPVFELATVYNSYREFPSIDPEAAYFLGIDVDTAAFICDKTFEKYLKGSTPDSIQETVRTARLLGCIRIIDFSERHPEHPASQRCIEHCCRDIEMILDSEPEI